MDPLATAPPGDDEMIAMQLRSFDRVAGLVRTRVPRPHPGPDEALVRLACAGVNFVDVQMRDGTFARSPSYALSLPATLGMEGAGTVVAVGDAVDDVAPGERVAYCTVLGSYAAYAVVPARRLVRLPPDVSFEIATALMVQGLTAQYLTSSTHALREGETCLVHAATGGVGQLLVQLAKRRGARVIATVGSPEKATIARALGADETILYREVPFLAAVLSLTDGSGVDVVYDGIGDDTIADSIRSTRRRGLCVLYGGSSGLATDVSPRDLAAGSIFFTRPHLAHHLGGGELERRANELFTLVQTGELHANVHDTFPLERANDALSLLESRATRGKILLTIDDDARASARARA